MIYRTFIALKKWFCPSLKDAKLTSKDTFYCLSSFEGEVNLTLSWKLLDGSIIVLGGIVLIRVVFRSTLSCLHNAYGPNSFA